MKKLFSLFLFFCGLYLCNAQESNLPVVKDSLNAIPQVYPSPVAEKDVLRLGVTGGFSYLLEEYLPIFHPF